MNGHSRGFSNRCAISLLLVWAAFTLSSCDAIGGIKQPQLRRFTLGSQLLHRRELRRGVGRKGSTFASLTPKKWSEEYKLKIQGRNRGKRSSRFLARAGSSGSTQSEYDMIPDEFDIEDYLDDDERDDPEYKTLPFGEEADQIEDELLGRGLETVYGDEYKVRRYDDFGDRVMEIDRKLEEAGAPIDYPISPSIFADTDDLHNVVFPPPEPGVFKNNTVMLRAHPLEVGWDDPETEILDDVNLTQVLLMDQDSSGYDDIEKNEVMKFRMAIDSLMEMMPRVETNPLAAIIRHPHLAEGYDVPVDMMIDDRFSHVFQSEQIFKKHNITEMNLDDMMYDGIMTLEKLKARRKRREEKRRLQGLEPTEMDFRWRYDGDLSDINYDMINRMNFKQLRAILALHATEERFSGVDTRRNGTWEDLKNRMYNLIDAHSFQARIERQNKRKLALHKVSYTQQRLQYILDMQKDMYPYSGYYHLGEKNLEAMEEWVEMAGGFKIPEVKILEEKLFEERTLVADGGDVEEGEMMMMVPKDLMITSQVARASTIGAVIAKRCPNVTSDNHIIAAYLCQEKLKGEDSFWKKYIDSLPKKMYSLPYRYPPEETGVRVLKGTYAEFYMKARLMQTVKTYEYLSKGLPINTWKKKVPFEMFAWALAITDSRSFHLRVGGGGGAGEGEEEGEGENERGDDTITALVPLIDMSNAEAHEFNAVWSYDDEMEAMVVTANKPIKQGEEILISYGTFTNTHWYVQYGLVFERLKWKALLTFPGSSLEQEAAFAITNSYDDVGVQNVFSHLRRSQQDITKIKATIESKYRRMHDVLAKDLRVDIIKKRQECYMEIRDLEEILGELEEMTLISGGGYEQAATISEYRKSLDPASVPASSCTGEITVLKALKKAVARQLKIQGSTLQEDAVKVAEKHILEYMNALADTCIPMLEMSRSALRRYKKQMVKARRRGEQIPFLSYIEKVVLPLIRQRREFQVLRRKGLLPGIEDDDYQLIDEMHPNPPDERYLPRPWKQVETQAGTPVYWNTETGKESWEHPVLGGERQSGGKTLALTLKARYARLASTWRPIQLEGDGGDEQRFLRDGRTTCTTRLLWM
eukprot:jgi/Bigna1/77373/fgenesh1_pg.47_\